MTVRKSKAGIYPLNRYVPLLSKEGRCLNKEDISFTLLTNTLMKRRKYPFFAQISIGVEIVRLVWVNAYKRVRFGKIERVKGHYRRY